jgi:uncharacterized protein YbjT (DUF2867 family)
MRVRVSGGGGFVARHVEEEAGRAGHELASGAPYEAAIHLAPHGVRAALDDAWAAGARVFALMSTLGANARASEEARAEAGRAEELVRASGLPWVELRPEILWGPGDVFTSELARLVKHLPFVPIPRRGVTLSPVFAGDVGRALVALVERPELWNQVFSLRGPEELRYGEVVARVAAAMAGAPRRRLAVPAWWVRRAVALRQRVAGRPRASRRIVDWRLSSDLGRTLVPPLPLALALRPMSVEALSAYLDPQPPTTNYQLPTP